MKAPRYKHGSDVYLVGLDQPLTVVQHPLDICRALDYLGEELDGASIPVLIDETLRK